MLALTLCCDSENNELTTRPAGSPTTTAATVPAGPSTMPTVSRFIDRIKPQNYEEMPSPDHPSLLRWDFSEPRICKYHSENELVNATYLDGLSADTDPLRQEISSHGPVLVKSKGDGQADLVLKSMKTKMKVHTGDNDPMEMEQTMPSTVVQGMKEDGSADFSSVSHYLLITVLFPLPDQETLEVGESVEVPAQFPFNAMGSMLQVKGHSRITLTRYVRINDRTCAELHVDMDISELDEPEELSGDYQCSARGKSIFYFDVGNRIFVSGWIALLTQFNIDAPAPKMKTSEFDTSDMPERQQVAMISDNFTKVVLQSVK
jgi:hypothetical protein